MLHDQLRTAATMLGGIVIALAGVRAPPAVTGRMARRVQALGR